MYISNNYIALNPDCSETDGGRVFKNDTLIKENFYDPIRHRTTHLRFSTAISCGFLQSVYAHDSRFYNCCMLKESAGYNHLMYECKLWDYVLHSSSRLINCSVKDMYISENASGCFSMIHNALLEENEITKDNIYYQSFDDLIALNEIENISVYFDEDDFDPEVVEYIEKHMLTIGGDKIRLIY